MYIFFYKYKRKFHARVRVSAWQKNQFFGPSRGAFCERIGAHTDGGNRHPSEVVPLVGGELTPHWWPLFRASPLPGGFPPLELSP